MPSVHSRQFWVSLLPKVRQARSWNGDAPSSRQEELEITHRDVAELAPRMVGTKVCYNHNDSASIGVVTDKRVNGDGSMEVCLELDTNSVGGAAAEKMVAAGAMPGVSLKHTLYTNEPIEVSICAEGARAGSGIYFDQATNRYMSSAGDEDPAIEASSTPETRKAKSVGFLFFGVRTVAASADPAADAAAAVGQASDGAMQDVTPTPEPAEKKIDDGGEEDDAEEVAEEDPVAEEEKKKLMAKHLKETTKVNDLLLGRGPNTIPTAASKQEIAESVRALEMAKLDKEAENGELKERLAQAERDLVEARQLVAHKDQVADTMANMAADVSRAARAGPAVLASAATKPLSLKEKKEKALKAATDQHFHKWLKAREEMTKATSGYTPLATTAPVSAPHVPQQQQQQQPPPIEVMASKCWTQPGISLKSVEWYAQQSQRPETRHLTVQASATRPIEVVVAASIGRGMPAKTYVEARRYEDEVVGPYTPGQGPNFPRWMLKTPQQKALWDETNTRDSAHMKTTFDVQASLGHHTMNSMVRDGRERLLRSGDASARRDAEYEAHADGFRGFP